MFGFALACGYEVHNDHSSDGCLAGSAGCPCAEDGGCDAALECVDGVCQPGPGDSTTSTAGATTSDASDGTSSTGSATTESATNEASCVEHSELWCDVFSQDCCDGLKCAAFDMDGDGAWESTKCVDVIGDGQHGEPCEAEGGANGIDDCAKGQMCWHLNEEGEGICVAQCQGYPEQPICTPSSTVCVQMSDGAIQLCLGCDPLVQDCPVDKVCVAAELYHGFRCYSDLSDGMMPEGAPCMGFCDPGLLCVDSGFYPSPACQDSPGCCAPYCDLMDIGACQGLSVEGSDCVPWGEFGTVPTDLEHLGVCGVMP